jgi:pilus assembly protein CpaB
MNRKRLLFIASFALLSGAAVSGWVYQRLLAMATPLRPTVDVVVAANDIDAGAKIGDRDIKIVKYVPDDLPADFFRSKAPVVGHGAVLPIHKGEFVLPDKLSEGQGLTALIAMGMRAEAVRVNDVSAVAGFAAPGTRVDVLVTGTPRGSSEPQTRVLLQDVLVLAVGSKTDRKPTQEPQNASVVTLLLSPDDATRLVLAGQEGRIQLVLRNPGDTKQETTAAITNTNLFGNAGPERPIRIRRTKPAPDVPKLLEIEILTGPHKETIQMKQ